MLTQSLNPKFVSLAGTEIQILFIFDDFVPLEAEFNINCTSACPILYPVVNV